MANVDAPFGLRAVRHRNGAAYNGAGNLYHVASGDSQVIAPGDPVLVTGTADTSGNPTVARATAGSRMTGVMAGMTNGEGTLIQDAALTTVTLTSQYILVHDDPDIVFEIQSDGDLDAIDISSNADLTAAAASNDRSQWEIDSTSHAVTATLQVKVLRLVKDERNALGANAVAEVSINLHTNSPGVGSLGI